MRFSLLVAAALLAGSLSAPAGTPQQADGIRRSYEADFKAWVLKLHMAASDAERRKLAADRPDAVAASKRMWAAIQPNLAEAWVVEPAAWLLKTSAGLVATDATGMAKPLMAEASAAIRQAVEKHHLASKNLAPMCLALVAANDPGCLPLLEKIERGNPDKKIQGVAALGIAMLLKDLSDEPEVMRRRLTMLKKAIIESSEVEVNGVTVAKLAEDELYIIRFLSKGREAPDLTGTDSGGRPMKLSNYQGKTVVLLFWRSQEEGTEQLCDLVKQMRGRFADKPFEIIGVNRDPQAALRQLQSSGVVDWPNFSDPDGKLTGEYRVAAWPLAYVLDGTRKIHYVGPMGSFVELTAAAVMAEK
jgi:peroxiredoxin